MVAFIPARAGSKGIPNKNIVDLGGKPLIAWTIDCAQRAGVGRIIVSTDGEEIAKQARKFGAEVMMRPEELAGDKTTMYEAVASEVPKIEPAPEYVVLLQPTVPFRKKSHIGTAINLLAKNSEDYDSLMTAEKLPTKYNPAQIIVSTPSGIRMANGAPISQRATHRQGFSNAWIPTGSIYVFKTKNLDKGSIYGDRVMVMETEEVINIDTPEDLEEARAWLKQSQK